MQRIYQPKPAAKKSQPKKVAAIDLKKTKPEVIEPKTTKQKAPKRDSKTKFLVPFLLVGIVLVLTFVAVKMELSKLYRLKSNERILLVHDLSPIAILFFNADNNQLILTDVRQANFDLSDLTKEASLSSESNRKVFYSFLLGTTFDEEYEYPSLNLDKNSLVDFFKKHQIYYSFLKNQDVVWIDKKYDGGEQVNLRPVFDCPVALINTTGETGLVTTLANLLSKSSFSIVKKDDNSENLDKTKIFYNPEEASCQELLEKVVRILPVGTVEANKEITDDNRASMVIFVGRDLADLYLFFVDLFHGQL